MIDSRVAARAILRALYSPDQPRDEDGRWTYTGFMGAPDIPTFDHFRHSEFGDKYNELDGYVAGKAAQINRVLRADGSLDKETKELDTLIASSPLGKDTELFRVVPQSVADQLISGDTFTDKGYVSTTASEKALNEVVNDIGLMGEEGLKIPISIIKIQAPKGLGHINVNETLGRHRYEAQKEIILPRGSSFRVITKTKRMITVKLNG